MSIALVINSSVKYKSDVIFRSAYNHVHNIFRAFDSSKNLPFLVLLLVINWYKRVASRAAKQNETWDFRKLWNIRKTLNFYRYIPKCLVLLPLLLLVKISWKKEIELFPIGWYFTWKLELLPNILTMIEKSL